MCSNCLRRWKLPCKRRLQLLPQPLQQRWPLPRLLLPSPPLLSPQWPFRRCGWRLRLVWQQRLLLLRLSLPLVPFPRPLASACFSLPAFRPPPSLSRRTSTTAGSELRALRREEAAPSLQSSCSMTSPAAWRPLPGCDCSMTAVVISRPPSPHYTQPGHEYLAQHTAAQQPAWVPDAR